MIHQYFGTTGSTSNSSFSDDHQFDFDEWNNIDEYNMEIYGLATGVNEEQEESGECQNSTSPVQQSSHEVSSEVEVTDLDDTGALNSDGLNLPADSKVVDGGYAEAESAAVVRTEVRRIPRRFCRTYLTESNGMVVNNIAGSTQNGKQKNLSSSQDATKAKDHEVVETRDEVTHL